VGTRTNMIWIVFMRRFLFATLSFFILLSSGCALHEVKGEVGGVEVEVRTKDSGGDFCPPGQAKKGKC